MVPSASPKAAQKLLWRARAEEGAGSSARMRLALACVFIVATVLFPFVPVMPDTRRRLDGKSQAAAARSARAARSSSTTIQGTPTFRSGAPAVYSKGSGKNNRRCQPQKDAAA